MPRDRWIAFAEILDALRIVPRLLLAIYGWVCWDAYSFVMSGEASDQQADFATIIWGAAAVWFSAYAGTGGKK